MANTAIIVLNWNGHDFLQKYLPSLVTNTPLDQAEVIVADNASTDDSIVWLEKQYPQVSILALDKNYGFAGGYNRAIEQCEHEFILLLNSDVEAPEGWFQPLMASMSDQQVAAVMPKIRSISDPDRFEYAGAAGGFIDHYGYPFCRGRIFDSVEPDEGQYNTTIPVFWTTGACMLVRRSVFLQAGGFDDDFYLHMEEIDLCWRMQRLGYTMLVNPESVVYHLGGGTLANESSNKLFLNYRNNLFLLFKNLPPNELGRVLIVRLLLDGLAGVMYLLTGKPKYMAAVLRAHFKFYTSFKLLRKKRKANQTYPKTLQGRINKSIVLSYFLQGEKKFNSLFL